MGTDEPFAANLNRSRDAWLASSRPPTFSVILARDSKVLRAFFLFNRLRTEAALSAASRYHYQRSEYHHCLTVRAMRQ